MINSPNATHSSPSGHFCWHFLLVFEVKYPPIPHPPLLLALVLKVTLDKWQNLTAQSEIRVQLIDMFADISSFNKLTFSEN